MGRSSIVPVRYPDADLALVEAAMRIMGDKTISSFTRSASVMLAKAIIEAHADAGGRPPADGWNSCWIGDATLERKPETS